MTDHVSADPIASLDVEACARLLTADAKQARYEAERRRDFIRERFDGGESHPGAVDLVDYANRLEKGAAIRETLASSLSALVARAREVESVREECAVVCEGRAKTLPPDAANEARKCARAIRAKGFASPLSGAVGSSTDRSDR